MVDDAIGQLYQASYNMSELQYSVSEPSKVTSSKQRNNCCSVGNRSCTKLLLLFRISYGTALGRSVDLNLISELDRMFDFKGRLINGSSGWHVTCTDDEGDMMLRGDYPWQLSAKPNTKSIQ
ncbi:hypothetical protein QQP08_000754 [Theobroma cacao]|nr:hypothetical protein QQP08_000754 [Theobroma cacao]